MMMGYFPRKRLSASSRYGRCSRVDGWGYLTMRGVCCDPETISQLAMLGLWNCVESMSHPSGLSLVTSTTSPCAPPDAVGAALEHVT